MKMRWSLFVLLAACLRCAWAQTDESEVAKKPEVTREDSHILGIVPDYDTVRNSAGVIMPISARTKWWLATEDVFDPLLFRNHRNLRRCLPRSQQLSSVRPRRQGIRQALCRGFRGQCGWELSDGGPVPGGSAPGPAIFSRWTRRRRILEARGLLRQQGGGHPGRFREGAIQLLRNRRQWRGGQHCIGLLSESGPQCGRRVESLGDQRLQRCRLQCPARVLAGYAP